MKNQSGTPNNLAYIKTNNRAFADHEKIKSTAFGYAVLKGVHAMVAIINEDNYLVFMSDLFVKNFNYDGKGNFIGKKIGETLRCIYYDPKLGCEGKKICSSCGVSSILKEDNNVDETESVAATIVAQTGDLIIEKSYELYSVNIELEGDKFKMLTINDISDLKRKDSLEKVYLRRMDNQLAVVKEQSDILRKQVVLENKIDIGLYDSLGETILQLKEKTSFQQIFSEAQNETLTVINEKLSSVEVYTMLTNDFSGRCANKRIKIKKGLEFEVFNFYSDKNILGSAIVAILENALAASTINSNIIISMSRVNESVVISVHNEAVMSAYVQLQVFRNMNGIGTYGAKLFIEKYLKGEVYFSSIDGLGTTFYLKLPLLMIC